MNSFTRKKYDDGKDPNRHFYVKNCPSLKELKMGRYSFSDYTLCEIEDTPALEFIEIGDLKNDSCNFFHGSFQLTGVASPCD